MHIKTALCGFLVLAGVTLAVLPGSAQKPKPGAVFKSYVILATGNSTAGLTQAVVAAGGSVTKDLEKAGVVLASSADPQFATRIAANRGVQGVSEDVRVQWLPDVRSVAAARLLSPSSTATAEPFDPYLWNVRQIGADKTAAAGRLGKGAVVAVLDTAIYTDHQDIAANLDLARSRSFVPGQPLQQASGFSHGTHVAGIIAAPINGVGVQGVAPEATLVALRVLGDDGSGDWGWLFEAIYYAASIRADVINMSLGATFDRINAGGGNVGLFLATLNRLITFATQSGSLCVTAAGNESVDLNSRLWSIPAQSGNGMAVSATGPVALKNFDRLASYSNYGQSVVDVGAPGGDFSLFPASNYHLDMILSPAGPRNSYYFAAGTSMAAPHVSGVAALLVGAYGKLSPSQLQSTIESQAADILKPGADAETGHGRLDAARTLGVQ
jgi:subtilisin family serine protease